MEQETIKSLTGSKEVNEFVGFVSKEMEKLNQVEDIDNSMSVERIGQEVIARKLAYKKVKDILEPLIDFEERSDKFNNQEYNV